MYRKKVLQNGVRVVAEKMTATKSVAIGIWVNVGSRDERPGQEGVSHFLEHMFFKGTKRRSASQISQEIDALGGEMNAFTSRENTAFYVKVIDRHLASAIRLLADLFHHSCFHPKEVEKEKNVVLEEIRMVQDDPEELLYDLHIQHQLHQHPLGNPILGRPHTIKRFNQPTLFEYIDSHYGTNEILISVAGSFEWKVLVPLLEKAFGTVRRKVDHKPQMRQPGMVHGGLLVQKKSLEQAHVCCGLPGFSVTHKDRYIGYVLNTALGGGVSSRLFQRIREERGLAYSIYSFLSSFSDAGVLTIYAATRPREAGRVIELIRKELRQISRHGLTPKELTRAKNQMKGSLMLSLEGTHSRMNKLAKEEMYQGHPNSFDAILRKIDNVTSSEVLRLARSICRPKDFSVTALGPVSLRSLQAALS